MSFSPARLSPFLLYGISGPALHIAGVFPGDSAERFAWLAHYKGLSEVKRPRAPAGIPPAPLLADTSTGKPIMKTPIPNRQDLLGRIPLLLFWLLGVPLPVLLLIWIFRG